MAATSRYYDELHHELQSMTIIDAHEHLVTEQQRINQPIDVLHLLSLYAWFDVMSAGLPTTGIKKAISDNYMIDLSVPLEKRWRDTWPYIQQIKQGSYYRPTKIALQDIYGISDLNEKTYMLATEKMRAANTPGIMDRILRKKCGIKTALVQNGQEAPYQNGLFTPVYFGYTVYEPFDLVINWFQQDTGVKITDLHSYIEAMKLRMTKARKSGTVGFKMRVFPFVQPDMAQASRDFDEVLNKKAPCTPVLKSTLLDAILKQCEQWDWPMACHTGVWEDYRQLEPTQMIDIISKYPGVRFDIYHLGLPSARETVFMAKNFPNCYINLCWSWVVSPTITRKTVQEILDLVPVNKIFGFGGDYIWEVENTYGHLVIAREGLAEAFAERVQRGLMDVAEAKRLLKMWMYDNPTKFYGLDTPSPL